MKHVLLFSSLLIALVSCTEGTTDKDRDELDKLVDQNSDTNLTTGVKYFLENTKVSFDNVIALPSTRKYAVPIILEEIFVDKMEVDYSYYNIAILDSSGGFEKFLFNESVMIEDIRVFEEQVDPMFYDSYESEYADTETKHYPEKYDGLIFFLAKRYEKRKSGFNQLFVYDLIRDSLTVLSPPNYDVFKWGPFIDRSSVFIDMYFDSNKNGKYDEDDDRNILITNPRQPNSLTPIFNLDELKELKLKVANENG